MRIGHIRPGRPTRYWRAFRTGLAFAVFGVGALVVTFGLIPLIRLTLRGREHPRARVQRLVHRAFRLFEWFMSVLGLIRVSRVGFDRLPPDGPRLIIANHPTLIDVVLLVATLPQADCVVKKAASRNPYLRGVVAAAGYIPNDEGEALVEACVARLREGRTLLLFPEGTRSPMGRLGPLHRGAAHIGIRSGLPLIPIVIRCSPPTLMKGQRWYDVPDRRVTLTLEVEGPIGPAADPVPEDSGPLAARRLTTAIQRLYEDRIGRGQRTDAAAAAMLASVGDRPRATAESVGAP